MRNPGRFIRCCYVAVSRTSAVHLKQRQNLKTPGSRNDLSSCPTHSADLSQGFHFFWACCTNLLLAGFIRLLVTAPRPFMYDQRLKPLTDRYETSYGLPSLETHMATVVLGWWVESAGIKGKGQLLARLLATGYIFFVAFTRSVQLHGE